MAFEKIIVLDFGGQYAHLIARRIREAGVKSEVFPCSATAQELKALECDLGSKIKGIVFSGGPSGVYEENAPECDPQILDLGVPVLGLCFGHQLIAKLLGGRVEKGAGEYGVAQLEIRKESPVFEGLDARQSVWMSHGDSVVEPPQGFDVLAGTPECGVAAFGNGSIFGLQFHPEVTHTENGQKMISNFVLEVCRCEKNWGIEDFAEKSVLEIKKQVGSSKAIIALSGGVDSSVATVLGSLAMGKNLTAVYVDNGFMRKGETDFVKKTFEQHFELNLIVVDAKERFFEAVRGVTDPEQKRKIIGCEFIRVFEEEARKINADYLFQGTIYPDRIESGSSKHSSTIKTHHNVGGLPEDIEFKGIIEPLTDLYKDEVRKVGENLDLPKQIVWRQPFPGPGLAVRIVGDVTPQKVKLLQEADAIVRETILRYGVEDKIWQYFAVLTGTKSTGVKGDSRMYGDTVAIRMVESSDAMTAGFFKPDWALLEEISTRITNTLPEVTRVVYDITHKPPATIEWE